LGPQTGPRQGEEQGTRCQPGGTVCRARKRRPFGAHVCLLDGSSIACTEPSGGPPCSLSPAHYLVMNKGHVLDGMRCDRLLWWEATEPNADELRPGEVQLHRF